MLTDTDRAILDLERSWHLRAGRKDNAIHELGMTPTTYYAQLHRLLDTPDALAHDPLTVRRLLRLRDARRAQRAAR